jgi:hypothetical protein
MRWRLEWGEQPEALEVGSEPALLQLLDELDERASDQPMLVDLISPAGDSLSIGLGRDKSVLTWVQANQEPPYFVSLSSDPVDGSIVFDYRGEWSEFPARFALDTPIAKAALVDFFRTGSLPTSIAWTDE